MSNLKKMAETAIRVSENYTDKLLISHRRRTEIRKMEDPRRVSIGDSVVLSTEQKKEVDDYFSTYYGERIPYTWHKYYTAYTGHFDVRYFPELLYIPEFEYFMNERKCYQRVFADKNVTPMIAQSVGVKTPRIHFSVSSGVYRDEDGLLTTREKAMGKLSDSGEVFIKPTVDSMSGNGCAVLNLHKGLDEISGKRLDAILSQMGENYVIQERVQCHESISNLYATSVNTFRVFTYLWKDRIEHVPLIMRIGQRGGVLDNAHAGGMFIAVEDSGSLHEVAFTEFREEYREHPDTHVIFADYSIPLVPKVIEAAEKLHSAIPQLGVVSWDLTIDKDGQPLLIEANTFGASIWFFQMAHGKGLFGENTEDILSWIREKKHMKKSERLK